MVQYILNATAIWLISLVCFDLFLKRENYHGYNRVYLLATFMMGLLVPLWQWQNDDMLHNTNLHDTMEQVVNTKQRIVTASAASTPVSWEQWLMILYMAGAAIALCILIADIVKLAMLSVKGTKSRQKKWTIIETGDTHAPFSFFNTLFVGSKHQYNDDEWDMILAHERRHTTLLHFADLLLMQLARIAFWFHPLVYVYNSRLLLVHEYQADNASAKEPKQYGRFLVEQAVLQAAPSITHSFNRSPIKNRIVMLTKRSDTASKFKMFVAIPLTMVCLICFSKNVISKQTTAAKKLPVAHLGNLQSMTNATYAEVSANAFITPPDPSYTVKEFTITYIPKDTFLVGPFRTQGNQFTPKVKSMLLLMKGKEFKLVIEDIKMEKDGKEVIAGAIFLRCKP